MRQYSYPREIKLSYGANINDELKRFINEYPFNYVNIYSNNKVSYFTKESFKIIQLSRNNNLAIYNNTDFIHEIIIPSYDEKDIPDVSDSEEDKLFGITKEFIFRIRKNSYERFIKSLTQLPKTIKEKKLKYKKCISCKDIKPLKDFVKTNFRYTYSLMCKKCLHEDIDDFYVDLNAFLLKVKEGKIN